MSLIILSVTTWTIKILYASIRTAYQLCPLLACVVMSPNSLHDYKLLYSSFCILPVSSSPSSISEPYMLECALLRLSPQCRLVKSAQQIIECLLLFFIILHDSYYASLFLFLCVPFTSFSACFLFCLLFGSPFLPGPRTIAQPVPEPEKERMHAGEQEWMREPSECL